MMLCAGLGSRWAGLFAIVPASVLLTIAFFVMFALKKTDSKDLKMFGYVVTVFVFAAAVLIFSTGLYLLLTDYRPEVPYKYRMFHAPRMRGGLIRPDCEDDPYCLPPDSGISREESGTIQG